jgi:predicted Zn-dependent protease
MIHLQPMGAVDGELIAWLAKELERAFKTEVLILPAIPLPEECYRRGQYNSSCIISKLRVAKRTLAVTSEDLYAKGLNFVFGEAELGWIEGHSFVSQAEVRCGQRKAQREAF